MKWLRMRPKDMNDLDEARRWQEIYGECDEEGGGSEGVNGPGGVQQVEVEVGRRKKAAVRSRRRGVGTGSGGGGAINGGGG